MAKQMRPAKNRAGGAERDRRQLESLFFDVQRRRLALTGAIMQLREDDPLRRPRTVLRILVALLRLEAANRKARGALGIAKPV